jgi:glycosyltransferase involved in cell wall biosynthesis
MIVRQEARILEKCLASVLPVIDTWCIVDTGSTDGTQDIIRSFFASKGIPGELHERPWVNFSHNRNQALELARAKADYLLLVDADAYLQVGARKPASADAYMMTIRHGDTVWSRLGVVATRKPWVWRGVVHEVLCCDEPYQNEALDWTLVNEDTGARNRDPDKYRKDAELLEAVPNRGARDQFYLAQSYRDSNQLEKALTAYLQRVAMGGWPDEVWYSLYQIAELYKRLDLYDQAIYYYLVTHQHAPSKAEPLYALAQYCRSKGNNVLGMLFAEKAMKISLPAESLFIETGVYAWQAVDEYAVNAFWAGSYRESLDADLKLLGSPALPDSQRARVTNNLRTCLEKLGIGGP